MSEFAKLLIILCEFIQWQWFSKTRKKREITKGIQRARMGDTAKLEVFFLGPIL